MATYRIEKSWDGNEGVTVGLNGREYPYGGSWRWLVIDVDTDSVESAHDLKREAVAHIDVLTTPARPLHLTHTGPFAGEPMCGLLREVAAARGGRFAHVPYTRRGARQEFFARHGKDVCPACQRVWKAAR